MEEVGGKRKYPSNLSKIEEWDKEKTAVDKHLFATCTQNSFYKVIDEINCPLTCFVDLGSGLGHLCFYMKEKHPEVVCMGIEYYEEFFNESVRRKNELFMDVIFMKEDLFKLDGSSFSEYDNYIFFSFDAVFPKELKKHIEENILLKCPKPAVWINVTEHGTKMQNSLYSAEPGVDENTPNVLFVEWSNEKIITKNNDETRVINAVEYVSQNELKKIPAKKLNTLKYERVNNEKNADFKYLYMKYYQAAGFDSFKGSSIQVTKYNTYMLKNAFCVNCKLVMAKYTCSCCGYLFCGVNCQRNKH